MFRLSVKKLTLATVLLYSVLYRTSEGENVESKIKSKELTLMIWTIEESDLYPVLVRVLSQKSFYEDDIVLQISHLNYLAHSYCKCIV